MPLVRIVVIFRLLFFLFQAAQKELADMSLALESERYRAERLEGQINDLTELHQVKFFSQALRGFR